VNALGYLLLGLAIASLRLFGRRDYKLIIETRPQTQ